MQVWGQAGPSVKVELKSEATKVKLMEVFYTWLCGWSLYTAFI